MMTTNEHRVTPEQMVDAIHAELVDVKAAIGREQEKIEASRVHIQRHRVRIKELRRMLPRKPRAKKAEKKTGA